jgi:multidrug transporter EmrE-like cation transporter
LCALVLFGESLGPLGMAGLLAVVAGISILFV